jgi:hypothetical protein
LAYGFFAAATRDALKVLLASMIVLAWPAMMMPARALRTYWRLIGGLHP